MITRKQLLSFWPDVLGIGALFLPFVGHISPLEILIGDYQDSSPPVIAAALSIPIVAWQALRVLRGVTTKTELGLAYVLSTAAMLCAAFWAIGFGRVLLQESSIGLSAWLAVGSIWTLIAANALLLLRNLKAAAPSEVSAGVFLVGGYLPIATFWLFFWFLMWPPAGDISAYFVLAASAGYVLRIISLMRRGSKANRPEKNPSVGK